MNEENHSGFSLPQLGPEVNTEELTKPLIAMSSDRRVAEDSSSFLAAEASRRMSQSPQASSEPGFAKPQFGQSTGETVATFPGLQTPTETAEDAASVIVASTERKLADNNK